MIPNTYSLPLCQINLPMTDSISPTHFQQRHGTRQIVSLPTIQLALNLLGRSQEKWQVHTLWDSKRAVAFRSLSNQTKKGPKSLTLINVQSFLASLLAFQFLEAHKADNPMEMTRDHLSKWTVRTVRPYLLSYLNRRLQGQDLAMYAPQVLLN